MHNGGFSTFGFQNQKNYGFGTQMPKQLNRGNTLVKLHKCAKTPLCILLHLAEFSCILHAKELLLYFTGPLPVKLLRV